LFGFIVLATSFKYTQMIEHNLTLIPNRSNYIIMIALWVSMYIKKNDIQGYKYSSTLYITHIKFGKNIESLRLQYIQPSNIV
jgi:hypothetical protein